MADRRGRVTGLPGDHTVTVAIPTVATGTEDQLALWANDTGARVQIRSISVIPDTTITGDNTNYMGLNVQNAETAGTSNVPVTDYLFFRSGTNATAFDITALTLSSTTANIQIDNGEVLFLNKDNESSGLALPAGIVVIRYQFV